MSATNHAQAIEKLLKRIAAKPAEEPASGPDLAAPLNQLIYSFLLWDSTEAKATQAYEKLIVAAHDINELRVHLPEELVAIIGQRYPLAEERIQRLRSCLHEVYIRQHEVSLDHLIKANKRDARKDLETLPGMVPFVTGRVLLLSLGGHAIPVDNRMLDLLIQAGVVEEGTDAARASSVLERHIKAADGKAAYLNLQAWSEKASDVPAPAAKTSKKKTTKKKAATSARKATKRV